MTAKNYMVLVISLFSNELGSDLLKVIGLGLLRGILTQKLDISRNVW